MRIRTAALLTLTALALATPAAAQGFGPPAHGHGPGADSPVLHMTKELGLSDAQTTQVTAIVDRYNDGAMGKAIASVKPARLAVQQSIHDLTVSDDQVREAASVVAVLESQIAVQHHQMAREISAVLTAEQREKLADMFADMKERHAGPGRPDGH
jgi:Spy/CpxP family protein refolding chaperone